MNERIKELAEQCTEVLWRDGPYEREEFNKEKFAELIVAECAEYIDFAIFSNGGIDGRSLKEHFGVEE